VCASAARPVSSVPARGGSRPSATYNILRTAPNYYRAVSRLFFVREHEQANGSGRPRFSSLDNIRNLRRDWTNSGHCLNLANASKVTRSGHDWPIFAAMRSTVLLRRYGRVWSWVRGQIHEAARIHHASRQRGGHLAARSARLGILIGRTEADYPATNRQLLDGLAQLGWTKTKNLRVDYRLAGSNDPAVIRPHAEALVRAAADVIFATPGTAVQVLQGLTSTIPIVFIQNGDPVQGGTVKSLARLGGNITGFLQLEPSINTKYLQLLKDIAPQLTRVAVLQTEASRSTRGGSDFAAVESASRSLAITPVALLVRDNPGDIKGALVAFAREPNGGLIVPPDIALTRRRASMSIALDAVTPPSKY
jgi:hypothetical protein